MFIIIYDDFCYLLATTIVVMIVMVTKNGIYRMANDSKAVVPLYKQKSYGKYKLVKLLM